MTVAKDLDLDVPGAGDQALGIERTVAKGALRLRLATGEGFGDLGLATHRAHAASAAARDRFQHDRLADRGEERPRRLDVADDGALDHRRARAFGGLACAQLVAEEVERLRRRADEGQSGFSDGAGEGGVLGEEAVAGMDRLAAGRLGERDDPGPVEISGGAGAAERMRFVGLAQVERLGVVFRIDRHALDPEIRRGAGDAHGDLAAVGDQELAEGSVGHGCGGPRRAHGCDGNRSTVESIRCEPSSEPMC